MRAELCRQTGRRKVEVAASCHSWVLAHVHGSSSVGASSNPAVFMPSRLPARIEAVALHSLATKILGGGRRMLYKNAGP